MPPTLVSQAFFTYYSVGDDVGYVTRDIPRIALQSESNAELVMTCQISGHLK